MGCVLGIDLGTGSAKAVLLDEGGDIIARGSAEYPLYKPHPGWVEQDPEEWYQGLCGAVREVLAQADLGQIACVGLSGQLNGAVFLDGQGQPLRRAPIWLDHRSQAECDWANERAGDLLRERAMARLAPVNMLAKVLWTKANEPEIFRQTESVLLPKDWLRYRLTGGKGSDRSDASVTAAFELYARAWSGEILEALDIEPGLFPPLADSADIVGEIMATAAADTGLVAGTPLVAGGGDMPCMILGSGVIAPGIVSFGIGTAAHATAFADELDPRAFDQLWPMCHPVPGKYAWLGCSFTGGASLKWFKEEFGGSYEDLTAAAAEVPAGAEGLFFMPWLAGRATPCPDTSARGGFAGLTLRHTRGHMVRAVMEGVVFDLRHSLECFTQLDLPINELRIGEGGSQSGLWRQIQADIFGRDVLRIKTDDLSAVGAALLAGVGCGLFADFETACHRAVKLGEMVRCQSEQVEFYERAFRRYGQLYPALKDWYGGQ
jgi:xylulokinase